MVENPTRGVGSCQMMYNKFNNLLWGDLPIPPCMYMCLEHIVKLGIIW